MLRSAIWLLEQEYRFGKKQFTYTDPNPDEISGYEGMAFTILFAGAALQTSAVSMVPYYSLYQAHAAMSWAVSDIAYSKANRGALRGAHTFYPRTLAFARRGGLRFVATKVGSRFIPIVGWALLAYDLWSVGKWIGEKTSPV